MWNNGKNNQQKCHLKLQGRQAALYDKFEGFVVDLMKVGKKNGRKAQDGI